MSRPVPAAAATLRMLRYLSEHPVPVAAARMAHELGLARSSTYHLLAELESAGFAVHYPEQRTWGIGPAAWEMGQSFTRQEPLTRLARRPVNALVDDVGRSAHLAVLHGADVLYLIEERATGQPPLVSDVGVRLPAHLTASGLAILSTLAAAQIRALFPGRSAFIDRTGVGPQTPSQLRSLLVQTRQRGYAMEVGAVTAGLVSIAVPVRAPGAQAALALTWADEGTDAHAHDQRLTTPESGMVPTTDRQATDRQATDRQLTDRRAPDRPLDPATSRALTALRATAREIERRLGV